MISLKHIVPYLMDINIDTCNQILNILQNFINGSLFKSIIPAIINDLVKKLPEFAYDIGALIENIIGRAKEKKIYDSELELVFSLIHGCFFIDKNADDQFEFNGIEVEELYNTISFYIVNIILRNREYSIGIYHLTLCIEIWYEIIIQQNLELDSFKENMQIMILEILSKNIINYEKITNYIVPITYYTLNHFECNEEFVEEVLIYVSKIQSTKYNPLQIIDILNIIEKMNYLTFRDRLWEIANKIEFEQLQYEFSIYYAIFFINHGIEFDYTHNLVCADTLLENIQSSMSMLLDALINTDWEEHFGELFNLFIDYQHSFIEQLSLILQYGYQCDYDNIRFPIKKKLKTLFGKIMEKNLAIDGNIMHAMHCIFQQWIITIFGEDYNDLEDEYEEEELEILKEENEEEEDHIYIPE